MRLLRQYIFTSEIAVSAAVMKRCCDIFLADYSDNKSSNSAQIVDVIIVLIVLFLI